VATKKRGRPLYEVFLERVIRIDAVQRHRAAAVTDDERTAQFFDAGRRPGVYGDFKWSLDAPTANDWGLVAPAAGEKPESMSPAMQQAWDAAVAAWRKFIVELANCEMIASGVNPVSGIRAEIDPVEWSRTELVLDVRNSDLIEGWYGRPPGKHTVRWSAITVRAAKQPRQKKTRGHGYDWERGGTRQACERRTSGIGSSSGGTRSNRCRRGARSLRRRSSNGSRLGAMFPI
jgi:hypothetical protein